MLVKIQGIVLDIEDVLYARATTSTLIVIRFSSSPEEVILPCENSEEMLLKLAYYSQQSNPTNGM
jgi:hypothetical protein